MTVTGMDAGTIATSRVAATGAPALSPWKLRVLAHLQTVYGRLAMVAVCAGMMFGLRMPLWWETATVLAVISVWPAQRKWFITAAALVWIFFEPPISTKTVAEFAPRHAATEWLNYWPIGVAVAWAIAWGYLVLVRRFPKSPVGRRPIIGLLLLYSTMLVAMSTAPLNGAAWFFLVVATFAFGNYLWFFAYTIAENMAAKKCVSATEVGNWRPFWGFTGVPLGKGWTYLNRVEAKTPEQLAWTQLRGLKLMLRAVVWTAVAVVIHRLLYGGGHSLTRVPDLGTQLTNHIVPTYDMTLEAMKAGQPYSWGMRWAALLTYFVLHILSIVIMGHKVIAVLRMAGYDAFRNTYRPFESTSIAEFYNRIYWYFKELLVTFFFYPTYLRYFKKRPKLRLFMATLAAAGLGNFIFHTLWDTQAVLRYGPIGAMRYYGTYVLYTLILGCAIAWSQLRVLANKGAPRQGRRKYAAIAGVFMFYLLISVIEEPNGRRGLADYGSFFVSLFRP